MSEVFEHKVDKSSIPTCNILGVNIAAINMDWLLNFTHENIKKLSGDYMCVANVHTTVTAYEDEKYRQIQNQGILAIPDGGPLASTGRKRGYSNMQRTTGPSYMQAILGSDYKYRHFFYGSTNETLEKLRTVIKEKYPNAEIAGMISPPFRNLTDEENFKYMIEINQANPDFVWVGLGAPKQEIWMSEHYGNIVGFMVGVGAAFDYVAGNIKRAPKWMQDLNLEWLYRLIQDPKRLLKRYLYTNTKYIFKVWLNK